ncbi:agmatinase [uncultured Thiodictyon sp.]|uniref:agmatinase n=1 Tax=uncultured Thiodictyon sp. TaxID=1846217 RepID=UPI0025E93ACF|nr:agmatinase [uncultured Thiodictyon sp.]
MNGDNRLNDSLPTDPDAAFNEIAAQSLTPVSPLVLEPPYVGIATFYRLPHQEAPEGLDIALVGVPYDGGLTGRTGTRGGPRAVRDASCVVGGFEHQSHLIPSAICRCADLGDVLIHNRYHHDDAIAELEVYYRRLTSAGVVPLTCGGDHSITLPILKALGAQRPVGLIHFDAHCDTASPMHGSRFHHGAPFRQAVEAGVLDPGRTVQIGIRGRSELLWAFSYESGMRVIHVEEVYEMGWKAVVAEVRRIIGDWPVYLSFDIDCLDPAYAPGTGTPEVGGITSFEAQQMIRGLRGLNFVGGDLMEVSPPFDSAGITALAGADLLFQIFCVVADGVAQRKAGQ